MIVKPVVSVCMITYGHENFISKAIETVLDQNTSFAYELVITNDCSPDNTDEIIKEIIENHPKGSVIRYYNHSENMGMMTNFGFALSKCKGEYIAVCEGDDYWSNSNKLQIQFDFLTNNTDFSLVGHNAKFNRNGKEIETLVRRIEEPYIDVTTSDLIQGNPFVTCGVMFRNIGFENIMTILDHFIVGDKAIFTLVSFHGKCRFFKKPLGFYRKHENSVTSKNRIEYLSHKKELINRIKHAKFWNVYSKGKFNLEYQAVKENRSRALTRMAFKNKDFKTAIYYSQFVNFKHINKFSSKVIIKCLQLISKFY